MWGSCTDVCLESIHAKHILVLEFSVEENVSEALLTGLRPHLNLATICERHILEQDGALTLFRVVDRFTIMGPGQEMPETELSFTLVVSFRSGEFRGPLELSIKIQSPSPPTSPPQELTVPLNFEAPEEKAAQIIAQLRVKVKEAGAYWIVVRLHGEEITRIPFRVVLISTSTGGANWDLKGMLSTLAPVAIGGFSPTKKNPTADCTSSTIRDGSLSARR